MVQRSKTPPRLELKMSVTEYKFVEGKDINQYIIKNLTITENYKHSISPYNDLITKNKGIKTKEEFTKEVQIAVSNRLQKLKK